MIKGVGSEARSLGPLLGGSATPTCSQGSQGQGIWLALKRAYGLGWSTGPRRRRPCEETVNLCVEVVGGGDGPGGAPPSSPLLCTPAGPSVSIHSRLFTGTKMTKEDKHLRDGKY